MADQVSGDFPLESSAFGIETKTAKQEEATPLQTVSVEPETLSEPEKVETVEPQEEEEQESTEQERTLRRKAQEAHNLVIELIGEKFHSLSNGRLSDEQLRQWFDEHPEIAEKANRSKKYKDQFRSLMERDVAQNFNDDIKARRQSQIEDHGTDDEPVEQRTATGEDNYMTKEEMKQLLAENAREIEEQMLEKRLKREREAKAEEFAIKNNIKDDEYTKLLKNAEVLYSSNDDMEFDEALNAAYRVLHPDKPKPVAVVKQGITKATPDVNTEVEKIMVKHGLTKDIAEDLVRQGKTADTISLQDGIPLMSWSQIK